jgi:hypothetical protein
MAEILFAGDWAHPERDPPECGNGWVPPSDGWYRPKFNVFDGPSQAMASCFQPDGSWDPLGFKPGSNCSFFQKVGEATFQPHIFLARTSKTIA